MPEEEKSPKSEEVNSDKSTLSVSKVEFTLSVDVVSESGCSSSKDKSILSMSSSVSVVFSRGSEVSGSSKLSSEVTVKSSSLAELSCSENAGDEDWETEGSEFAELPSDSF